ncbi:unnamed protein product [Brassicogethes aeneus]|uniref:Fibronectin type-III domain-containing protein n=1 Tax=Brassicogethes aeneus TaxID=1431903 RepID=A0A9P0B407_BRAAE|nr:unnamed protein product [Brassicogethes aeneus]
MASLQISRALEIQNKTLKPQTIARTRNEISLNWEKIFPKHNNAEYTLQILDEFKEWKKIYSGPQTTFKVTNLAPCSVYSFRVSLKDTSNWLEFKSATSEDLENSSHMARAIKMKNTNTVKKIAQNNPRLLETENKELRTPLVQAIDNNDFQMVQCLHNLGVNVNNHISLAQRTPLMISVYLGYLDIAQFLISKGANVNDVDINGSNIIHYAVDSNNKINVEFAIKSGAHINCQTSKGWTPLIRAANLKCSSDIHKILMDNGCDTTIKSKSGMDYKKYLTLG